MSGSVWQNSMTFPHLENTCAPQGQGCEPIVSCAFPVKVEDRMWLSLMSPE